MPEAHKIYKGADGLSRQFLCSEPCTRRYKYIAVEQGVVWWCSPEQWAKWRSGT